MIKAALYKLTLFYVVIIMFISLTLSYVLYSFSHSELQEDYRRSYANSQAASDYSQLYANKSRQLIIIFIYFNLFILLSSIAISYLLANKTFQPIDRNQRAQARFIAQASHELRTPITAMKLDSESILQSPNKTYADLEKTLRSNLKDLSKLEQLSKHLLDMAKYQTSSVNNLAVFDMNKLIKKSIEQIKRSHRQYSQVIIYKGETALVNCDELAIELVMTILLDNAYKYSYQKSSVEVNLTVQAKRLRVDVKSYGPVIDNRDLKRIFEPFYRSTKLNDQTINGYGLGLSLAKQIISRHKGNIDLLVNKELSLSDFYFELPIFLI